jgi:hypothetical protein
VALLFSEGTNDQVIDKLVAFDEDTDGSLVIKHSQYIPEDFISQLKRDKIDTDHERMGDFVLAASIPVSVVEDLQRKYNFDALVEPVAETLKMLKKHHLDAFITSNKRVRLTFRRPHEPR